MKKILFITILLLMFTLTNKSFSKYDKIFFDLKIKSLDGYLIELSDYKNKAVLVVNVASNCGFTKQYSDLQNLWEKYRDKNLVVLGVPSNQFGGQEPGSNADIKNFCETNFNINFPITLKYDVKGENAHDIYKWAKNDYGKSAVPKWNFHKILIDKNGKVHDTFASFTNPLSQKIIKELDKIL